MRSCSGLKTTPAGEACATWYGSRWRREGLAWYGSRRRREGLAWHGSRRRREGLAWYGSHRRREGLEARPFCLFYVVV